MKEIISMNKKLWEDLNVTKAKLKTDIETIVSVTGDLNQEDKKELSQNLEMLLSQRDELRNLDQLIPELEGYEPKCNHEPGEVHSHNMVDINGMDENDLLAVHKELRVELNNIMTKVK